MKKALTILFLSLSAILILDSALNAVHALMMFLLAGVIPGTNIAISGDRMLRVLYASYRLHFLASPLT